MNSSPIGRRIACSAALAALLACTPPAAELPADEPAAEEVEPARAAQGEADAAPARPERRERRPSASAQADAQYKYIDERGAVRLAARLEDIPERQRSTAMRIERPSAYSRPGASAGDERATSDVAVTIYTTRACGYCRAAMAHFDRIGIDYTNRDVEYDEEAREEYLELTGGRRGVPVIVVGDSFIQGWSQAEFDRLLASAR